MRKISLLGMQFGRWTVIAAAPSGPKGQSRWLARCECGTENEVFGSNLKKNGNGSTSCGCLAKERARETMAILRAKKNAENQESLLGKRFAKCVVQRYVGIKKGVSMWEALCDCGTLFTTRGSALVYGQNKSCGCLRGAPLREGRAMRNNLLNIYKCSARNRGLVWDISGDLFDALTKMNCFYCGVEPTARKTARQARGSYTYNGIDRKDSQQGYLPDNVVPCCRICNFAKSNLPYEAYMEYLNRLVNFQIKKRAMDPLYREFLVSGDLKGSECGSGGHYLHAGLGEDAGQVPVSNQSSIQ